MRLSIIVVPVLAIGLALPAVAQTADQQIRQQVESVHKKWVEAVNKGDAQSFAAVIAPNAISIDAFGKGKGPPSEEFIQGIRKRGISLSTTIDEVQSLQGGQAAIASGSFMSNYTDATIPPGKGNWLQIYEREGDGWKIRAYAASRVTLPPPTK
jgi:ketosteroid isomerase-like protein